MQCATIFKLQFVLLLPERYLNISLVAELLVNSKECFLIY